MPKIRTREAARMGRPSRFRGKIRDRVITFTMTQAGHDALRKIVERGGRDQSRADAIEDAILEKAARL